METQQINFERKLKNYRAISKEIVITIARVSLCIIIIYQLIVLIMNGVCNYFIIFACIGGLGIQSPINSLIKSLRQLKK